MGRTSNKLALGLSIISIILSLVIATVVVTLSAVYIPRTESVTNEQRLQLEALNETALMLISRVEALTMDMSTNATLLESGTCRLISGVSLTAQQTINYELYSVITHENATIYFIKFLPMQAPASLASSVLRFELFSGPLVFRNFNYEYANRMLSAQQSLAFTFTSNPAAYMSNYVFFNSRIDFGISGPPPYTVQLTSPIIVQIPIEPVYVF